MPFQSLAQMRYMYSQHPNIAHKWHDETKAEGKPFPHGNHADLDLGHSLSGHHPVDAAAEAMHPRIYKYKSTEWEPRSHPNGSVYAGIYAQDLEKNPLTRQAIQRGPDGGLRVEIGPQVSTLSAIAGRHAERLNAIEHHVRGLMQMTESIHMHLHHRRGVPQPSERENMLGHLHEILGRKA